MLSYNRLLGRLVLPSRSQSLEELIAEEDAVLTITSSDPSIVNIPGASDGKLELKFSSDDGELTQSFEVEAIGRGSAALVFSNAYGVCFNPAGGR